MHASTKSQFGRIYNPFKALPYIGGMNKYQF